MQHTIKDLTNKLEEETKKNVAANEEIENWKSLLRDTITGNGIQINHPSQITDEYSISSNRIGNVTVSTQLCIDAVF